MFTSLPGSSKIAETLPSFFPGYHSLKKCYEQLLEIQGLFDGLSEHRRLKILTHSQAGKCHSLETLEFEWERLADDYRDLCKVYEQSSILQQSFLGSRLQTDAAGLEHRLREFYKDTWKTTVVGSRWMSWNHKMREKPF